MRPITSRDPNYEDDRWLEAEIANKEMTAEERYAFQKQHELLKQMKSGLAGLKSKEPQPVESNDDAELAKLRQQAKSLESRIAAILARKEK